MTSDLFLLSRCTGKYQLFNQSVNQSHLKINYVNTCWLKVRILTLYIKSIIIKLPGCLKSIAQTITEKMSGKRRAGGREWLTNRDKDFTPPPLSNNCRNNFMSCYFKKGSNIWPHPSIRTSTFLNILKIRYKWHVYLNYFHWIRNTTLCAAMFWTLRYIQYNACVWNKSQISVQMFIEKS